MAPSAAYIGSYGLEVSVGSCPGQQDAVLTEPPAPGALSVEACISIVAGGSFSVAAGSAVTFTAGRVIALRDGFTVDSGGSFASAIDRSLDPYGWVGDDSPASETRYLAQFFVDLDGLTLGTADELDHFVGYSRDGTIQLRLVIRHGPELWLEVREDDGGYRSTSPGVPLAPGWNRIALAWEASNSAAASLTVNGGGTAGLAGLHTGGCRIDHVRWGIVGGSLGASAGSIRQDAFSSWR